MARRSCAPQSRSAGATSRPRSTLCRCARTKCASATATAHCHKYRNIAEWRDPPPVMTRREPSMSIQTTRIRVLDVAEPRPNARYVLYWMQQSQRARFNPALEFALEEANARDLPVLVCFGLTDGYPEANARHYAFMLEGLAEVARALEERGVAFVIRRGAPDEVALD